MTVNTVVPGSTRIEGVRVFVQGLFLELAYEEAERRFVAENRATSIIARLIDPAEVADLVAVVCSQRASAINGAALRVDNGLFVGSTKGQACSLTSYRSRRLPVDPG